MSVHCRKPPKISGVLIGSYKIWFLYNKRNCTFINFWLFIF